MKTTKQKFLEEVEAVIKDYKMAPSAFGTKFAGSPSFVFDLRKGRNIKLDTMDSIRAKMKALRGK